MIPTAPIENITFEPFPKIGRLFHGVIITEKLDGTNAQIIITNSGEIRAASRNRLISVGDDNYGFARWVEEHKEELVAGLGPGRHFGEWWGVGIQRGYGLHERRFSLFNVLRWHEDNPPPACCSVVPLLGHSDFAEVNQFMDELHDTGSRAAPGYMKPEGIVIFHRQTKNLYKKTFEHDKGKWTASKELENAGH